MPFISNFRDKAKDVQDFDYWNSVNFTVILNSSLLTYIFSFKL